MNIWRTVHRELTAAWRSLRYDLRKPARHRHRTEVIPQVTADGDEDHPEYGAYARRTRRMRTALAVAALSAGGAAATYFGVVGGLSALLAGDSAPPGALPGVNAERPPVGPPPAGASGRASRPGTNLPSMRPPATTPADAAEPAEPADSSTSSRPTPPRREPAPVPTTTRRPPVPTPAPDPTSTCPPTPTTSPTPSPGPSPDPTPPPEPPERAVAPAS